ncbi:MAG: LytR C-terminal domain-containing protein [Aeromicrobium sp.]|uniref:LytR C-terminal domain-containing protein n=1 Tax=Aeromicrobium sp. TaxID=1871063 RepID=UPI0039E5749C
MSKAVGALTTVVALGVFGGGAFAGWNMLTEPVDGGEKRPSCTMKHVAAGEPLTANLVQVDVFNASGREGLANRASINLQRQGFLAGTIGNSESEIPVDHVAILTEEPESPLVELVAAQFQVVPQIVAPDIPIGDGVTVVVGPNYTDVKPGAPTEITAEAAADVCVPDLTVGD